MDGNFLLAIFVLLAVTVALVPLAKAAGLGTILGYLAAGVLIGPYGLGLISDTETIRHISEFGIVMMLFLIGLELQPRELWRMRNKVAGLGLTQYLGTAALIAGIGSAFGLGWQAAIIVGLTLAMSSTAIALQTIAARGIMQTDTGRGSLAVLLVQDVAVIPVLAIIPLLTGAQVSHGGAEAAATSPNWVLAIQIAGAFAITILAGRYLMRPLMRAVARANIPEAFTALALAIVVGAAVLMEAIGLSPALGAFLGGVLLSDSEYRHELQGTIAPFQGLLLGLFFISVGTSIAFSVLAAQPFTVLGLVLGMVAVKALVLYILASLFRMHIADRLLFAALLSQTGEFAFVLLQFAGNAGTISGDLGHILTVAVALSMATTPLLLFGFDKLVRPRFQSAAPAREPDQIDQKNKVILLGYGRFGQIVTRLIRAQGFEMTLIDDDPAQIEMVKRFGVEVFYGSGDRLEILQAAGIEEAELLVIAVAGPERILSIARLVRRHYPSLKIAARAYDRTHAHELMEAGVEIWERETFKGALALGVKALEALGYSNRRASRLAKAFEEHDTRILNEAHALRGDAEAYVGYMRQSIGTLEQVMLADVDETGEEEEQTKRQDTTAAQ